MTKKRLTIINIVLWIICFELISFLMGLLTQANIDPWYRNLYKSILTPPPFAFSIVWPLLYALLAIVGAIFWQRRHHKETRTAFYCFWIQMLMNWLWTPLFFHMHWKGVSFFWIVALFLLTATTIYLVKDKIRKISILLAPYLLWVLFAAYLNGFIWVMNS